RGGAEAPGGGGGGLGSGIGAHGRIVVRGRNAVRRPPTRPAMGAVSTARSGPAPAAILRRSRPGGPHSRCIPATQRRHGLPCAAVASDRRMRLSTIKLSGFKSFVDPTVLHLPTNMTGVVGPNGCGKSNIIDAVRWVMGESSASRLRGDSLTDV